MKTLKKETSEKVAVSSDQICQEESEKKLKIKTSKKKPEPNKPCSIIIH